LSLQYDKRLRCHRKTATLMSVALLLLINYLTSCQLLHNKIATCDCLGSQSVSTKGHTSSSVVCLQPDWTNLFRHIWLFAVSWEHHSARFQIVHHGVAALVVPVSSGHSDQLRDICCSTLGDLRRSAIRRSNRDEETRRLSPASGGGPRWR